MNTYHNTLNYWYNLEYFSPFWPEQTKETKFITTHTALPWEIGDEKRVTYDIYLGNMKTQHLIAEMIRAIGDKDDELDQDNSKTCACGFKVTSEGKYVEESFSVATFVWAMAKIIGHKKLLVSLTDNDLQQFNHVMNDYLKSINESVTVVHLQQIYEATLFNLQLPLNKFSAVITPKKIIEENYNLTDNTTDIMPSFYTSDIKMIKDNIKENDRIIHYIDALHDRKDNKVEIDTNIEEMKKWLEIEKYPIGKWPSIHNPSLMQQLSINIAIAENANPSNIFSVNGPPGTGKTTLLKEIIAHYIVERALKLSKRSNPDEAFKKELFSEPPNDFLQTYYQIDLDLTKYGILVASNNNAAVENISKELPIAKKVKEAHTNLFNVDIFHEIYFSEIATALMGNESWGLISARLGKKSNINGLIDKLWFSKDIKNLQECFKSETTNWQQAKRHLEMKYEEFIKYRCKISKTIEQLNGFGKQKNQLIEKEKKLQLVKERLKGSEEQVERIQNQIKGLEDNIINLKESESMLKSRIPWYKKNFVFFFKSDEVIIRYLSLAKEVDEYVMELSSLQKTAREYEKKLILHRSQYDIEQNTYIHLVEEYEKLKAKVESSRAEFGEHFADDDFWLNIEENKTSQIASPWTNKTFDKLREELFHAALQVQKAFILNSRSVKQNLNALINMWQGNFTAKDKQKAYATLLNTLFLVVPVASTTFASVSTFLKDINKEELGTLIIDESGQATPQSALGALWRTKKAIIVGDPLQVEPVLTIPKQLLHSFSNEFSIHRGYQSPLLSVQRLADSINQYGGFRKTSDESIWLGCPLVIHRRCINPMFTISNSIAYNNRMFMETECEGNENFLFEKSCWIDVRGAANGGKDHFVEEQGILVVEQVLTAIHLQKSLPSLYIISPFKSVIYGMKKMLRTKLENANIEFISKEKITQWINDSCGTVHTFQGKEADEVILLLGCDKENGEGAVDWASKKPNILNVAATRAKYRLAIVGDSELWGKRKYFETAYKQITNNNNNQYNETINR